MKIKKLFSATVASLALSLTASLLRIPKLGSFMLGQLMMVDGHKYTMKML